MPAVERTLRNLVLIRARHLAETMTTPTFLTDAGGNLIFYNEPAEAMVGRTFAEEGPLPVDRWQSELKVRSRDGSPFPLEEMPGWVALQRNRPGLGHVRFTAFDGTDHVIELCAIPLFTHPDLFEGALIIFWEDETAGADAS